MKKLIKTINFIVGSSGSGKNEVLNILSKKIDKSKFIISYTTREPRLNETNGVEYLFISNEKFIEMKFKLMFLESTEYEKNNYGHASDDLISRIENDNHFNMIIEPNGIYQILDWFNKSKNGIDLKEKYDFKFNILHIKTKKSLRLKRLLNNLINKNDSYDIDFEKTNKVINRIQRDDDNIDSTLEYLLENYFLKIQPSLKYKEIMNNDTLITLTTKFLSETIEKSNDVNYFNEY